MLQMLARMKAVFENTRNSKAKYWVMSQDIHDRLKYEELWMLEDCQEPEDITILMGIPVKIVDNIEGVFLQD